MNQTSTIFRDKLAFGQVAETYIALWLRRTRGWAIVPVYEKEFSTGKGPRFFTPTDEIVAPDMLIMKGSEVRWIEAKHKTVFTWWRIGQCWETGIDLHHYEQYCEIADRYPWPVWLLFLHESSTPHPRDRPYCPAECPTGLFGGTLERLRTCESHRDPRWGKTGMVYWKHETLHRIATLDEVKAAYTSDPIL